MASDAANQPIFILGVPRSGTTLLRTILDSHSRIACGPETPWLGGHQPRSIMELWRFLREDPHGYVASYGRPGEAVTAAARRFVDDLLSGYARARGKSRWAEKTPDNALYVDFLLTLFPRGRFVHLVRDGLDVALSTCVIEEHRRGISGFLERHLGLGPAVPPVENNLFNAILKWSHWNRLIERSLAGREHLRVSYERLVTEPEATVRGVTDFIGEPFEPAMLDYSRFRHEYPPWEWGSADVVARGKITGERAGRGRRELSQAQRAVLEPLTSGGSDATDHDAVLLSGAAPDEATALVSGYLAGFARPLGLEDSEQSLHTAAWLWRRGIAGLNLARSRVLAVECGRSPIPWAAAMLGAEVVVTGAPPDPALERLRDHLRLPLRWAADAELAPDRPDVALVLSPTAPTAAHLAAASAARLIAATSGPGRTELAAALGGAPPPPAARAMVLVNRRTVSSSRRQTG
jgi:hypothetical protein